MNQKQNLYRELLFVCNLYPERKLSFHKGKKIKYRQLVDKIDTVSTFFYVNHYSNDDSIYVNKELSIETIILFYASCKLGMNIIEHRMEKDVYAIIKKNDIDLLYITKTERTFMDKRYILWKTLMNKNNIDLTFAIKQTIYKDGEFAKYHNNLVNIQKVIRC